MQKNDSDLLGLTWWNGCTRLERVRLLHAAEILLCRPPAPVDAWELWKAGKIRMDGEVSE